MEQILKNSPSGLDNQEISLLKEKFISKYCKQKGWDPNNLTTEQFLEICQNKEYKNPGLILG